MHINDNHAFVAEWIDATNSHQLERYLSFFTTNASLDDPSVGELFPGKERIGEYFTSYFIGYNTQTRLISIEDRGELLHVEVDFTGTFPGGQTGGTFDLTFEDGLIKHVRADLS